MNGMAQCPFDKNHIIETSKIKAHIRKCKSPNKSNFVQCDYNPDHWVNFSRIKEHEQCKYFCI